MKKNKTPRPNPSEVGTDTPAVTPAVIMNQTDSPKIRLENITYYYGKGTPFEVKALDSVSLDIHGGKLTGIIGHTGSGKSTLVQLLNGLSRAGEGRVLLDGEDIWARPKEIGKIRYRVGLVMQYPEYQLFEETVFADIAYGPRNMKLSEEEVKERVYKAAAFAGVSPDLMEKSPFDLSGGQKRRVAIAGIMAMEPEVLVLDEPAAGLDPQGRHTIFQGIREYNRNTGCTVLIVSHSMEDMAQYCDDVVVMAHSKVLMAGDRDHVFDRADELEAVGLDIPQVTKLCQLLRRGGMPIPAGLYTVGAAEDALVQLFSEAKKEKKGGNRL
jgi:energy-coupling factor transport system ATP-binding protein